MKFFLPILLWLWPCLAIAQIKVVSSLQKKDTTKTVLQQSQNYKPEIFTSGFIDIINSGQVNASARFIRLYIGEPGKFALPLSLYSGVSSNNFQNTQVYSQRSNDALVTNFINPLS